MMYNQLDWDIMKLYTVEKITNSFDFKDSKVTLILVLLCLIIMGILIPFIGAAAIAVSLILIIILGSIYGIRYRYLLIDGKTEKTRYLVDNYNDHGPHEHPVYHLDKNKRVPFNVRNQADAKDHFFNEVERILGHEK